MSTPSSHPEGLAHSAPLVAVAGVPPTVHGRQSLTPAEPNHPLAPSTPGRPVGAVQAVLPTGSTDVGSPTSTSPGWGAQQQQQQPQQAVTPTRQAPSNPSTPQLVMKSPYPGTPAQPPQVQSLDDFVDAFLSGPSYRTEQLSLPPLLRPAPLANEDPMQCLRILVERRAWGDVLQVASVLLRGSHSAIYGTLLNTVADEGNSSGVDTERLQAETVEVLTLQCHAWLKLRRYADLGREVDRWNFISFNNVGVKPPAWVPWSLHILAAETLQYTADDFDRVTNAILSLLSRIPETEYQWKLSTHRALVNAFLRKREWRFAIESVERMLGDVHYATVDELKTTAGIDQSSMESSVSLLESAYRTELLSMQGRILLQAGAIEEAAQVFEHAQEMWTIAVSASQSSSQPESVTSHVAIKHAPAQLLVNDGLLAFAYSNHEKAMESFRRGTDQLRTCKLTPTYTLDDWLGPSVIGVAPHAALFNECVNNMAIAALYMCRMHDAVAIMEGLVREDPTAFLTERVAFNLCTLYELGADTATSARKKRVLQLVAKRFFLHDVGPESFRIS